jgi:hypothetical protein
MDRSGSGVDHNAKQLTSYASPDELEDEEFEPHAQKARSVPASLTTKLMRWTAIFLTHASALMLGFAVAYFLFPRIVAFTIDPITGEIGDGRALLQRYLEHPNDLPKLSEPRFAPPPTPPPASTTPPAPAAPGPATPTAPPPPAPPPATPGSHP